MSLTSVAEACIGKDPGDKAWDNLTALVMYLIKQYGEKKVIQMILRLGSKAAFACFKVLRRGYNSNYILSSISNQLDNYGKVAKFMDDYASWTYHARKEQEKQFNVPFMPAEPKGSATMGWFRKAYEKLTMPSAISIYDFFLDNAPALNINTNSIFYHTVKLLVDFHRMRFPAVEAGEINDETMELFFTRLAESQGKERADAFRKELLQYGMYEGAQFDGIGTGVNVYGAVETFGGVDFGYTPLTPDPAVLQRIDQWVNSDMYTTVAASSGATVAYILMNVMEYAQQALKDPSLNSQGAATLALIIGYGFYMISKINNRYAVNYNYPQLTDASAKVTAVPQEIGIPMLDHCITLGARAHSSIVPLVSETLFRAILNIPAYFINPQYGLLVRWQDTYDKFVIKNQQRLARFEKKAVPLITDNAIKSTALAIRYQELKLAELAEEQLDTMTEEMIGPQISELNLELFGVEQNDDDKEKIEAISFLYQENLKQIGLPLTANCSLAMAPLGRISPAPPHDIKPAMLKFSTIVKKIYPQTAANITRICYLSAASPYTTIQKIEPSGTYSELIDYVPKVKEMETALDMQTNGMQYWNVAYDTAMDVLKVVGKGLASTSAAISTTLKSIKEALLGAWVTMKDEAGNVYKGILQQRDDGIVYLKTKGGKLVTVTKNAVIEGTINGGLITLKGSVVIAEFALGTTYQALEAVADQIADHGPRLAYAAGKGIYDTGAYLYENRDKAAEFIQETATLAGERYRDAEDVLQRASIAAGQTVEELKAGLGIAMKGANEKADELNGYFQIAKKATNRISKWYWYTKEMKREREFLKEDTLLNNHFSAINSKRKAEVEAKAEKRRKYNEAEERNMAILSAKLKLYHKHNDLMSARIDLLNKRKEAIVHSMRDYLVTAEYSLPQHSSARAMKRIVGDLFKKAYAASTELDAYHAVLLYLHFEFKKQSIDNPTNYFFPRATETIYKELEQAEKGILIRPYPTLNFNIPGGKFSASDTVAENLLTMSDKEIKRLSTQKVDGIAALSTNEKGVDVPHHKLAIQTGKETGSYHTVEDYDYLGLPDYSHRH